MDTMYCTLKPRLVKVSGGPDLIRFDPIRPEAGGRKAGQLLDLESYRARLAAQAPSRLPSQEDGEEPVPQVRTRRERWADRLELGATAAVILAGLAAAAAFLAVL